MNYFFINHNVSSKEPKTMSEYRSYTAGNLGNSYIGYTAIKMLTGSFRRVQGIPNLWDFNDKEIDISYINSNYSKVVLCLQDQIRVNESYYKPDYTKICDFLEKIQLPFVVFSLGANAFEAEYDANLHLKLSQEKVRFLNLIADKSITLGVRGYYTAEVLNKLGIKNVDPVGCHTFFINNKKEIIKKDVLNIKNIVTTGGLHPDETINKGLTFSYILQCQAENKLLFEQEQTQKSTFLNLNELYDLRHLSIFQRKPLYFPKTINEWTKIIKKYDFSIGRRVHGTILALNYGVPALLASGDLRAREMSELFSIPLDYTLDQSVDVRNAYEKADFTDLNKKFRTLYQRFLDFAKKNDVKIY